MEVLCLCTPGVDIVLNSLAEEKLQASLRVLAQHGRFLEIGKFDLSNNTALGTKIGPVLTITNLICLMGMKYKLLSQSRSRISDSSLVFFLSFHKMFCCLKTCRLLLFSIFTIIQQDVLYRRLGTSPDSLVFWLVFLIHIR